jgi:hypothetical protein
MVYNQTSFIRTIFVGTLVAFSFVTNAFAQENVVASAPVISSPTHPDQNAWYASREASFEWTVPASTLAVRTLYDEHVNSVPNKVYDPPISTKSFTTTEDGMMFMHVQLKTEKGWGSVAHYRFQIDTKAPENLAVAFPEGTTTTNPMPSVRITAQDTLSGLDYLTITIDNGAPMLYQIDPLSRYRLQRKSPGNHTMLVTVYDKAGNTTQTATSYTLQTVNVPTITSYSRHVGLGGTFSVSGMTSPKTIIEVALINEDNIIKSERVTSNEKGEYSLAWSGNVPVGAYEMRVRAIDQAGGISEYTDAHVVTFENLALIRTSILIMNWLSLIIVIIVAGVAMVGVLWYGAIAFGRFRRKVHRTMREAENTLKTNVSALRRDVEEFQGLLLKAEKKRALTKEEQSILKKFKKRLQITEDEIEKKLEAVS